MHVISLGAAREIQEGIAVDPLLVGCGVKPHDFSLINLPIKDKGRSFIPQNYEWL